MARTLRINVGDIVSFYSVQYEAVDVYSYIVYLKELTKDIRDSRTICVGMGDLVMGGAYITNRKNPEIFTYSPRPQAPSAQPRIANAFTA